MKQLRIIITALLLPAFAFAAPNNPSNLTFTNVTSHSVTLNWQDNSGNETGFKILVNGKYVLKTATDITHFTVGNLTPNTDYEFTVKATDSNYEHDRATISTNNQTYHENEDIVVSLRNLVQDNENWVGIYPKDASNDWGNKIAWNRPKGQTSLTFAGIATGEYEARLFYSSSFELLAKVGFSVTKNGNNYVYGSEGPYLNQVKIDNNSDKYVLYYPEGHVKNAPLVLVIGYTNTIKDAGHPKERLEGLMTYLASLGCYVIGHKKTTGGWTDTVKRKTYFMDAVENAKNLGVNIHKLAVVGKSGGGMHSYALMKYFKNEKHYGQDKSLIIDLMGYYALDMDKNDLINLNVDSLIFNYGGYTGVQKYRNVAKEDEDASEDPRTLLSISKILKHGTNKASFIVHDTQDHSYEAGNYNQFKSKTKLVKPIDAMIKYEFFNENGMYTNASPILFDNYNAEVSKTSEETLNYIDNGGKYTYDCDKNRKGINYCEDYR